MSEILAPSLQASSFIKMDAVTCLVKVLSFSFHLIGSLAGYKILVESNFPSDFESILHLLIIYTVAVLLIPISFNVNPFFFSLWMHWKLSS